MDYAALLDQAKSLALEFAPKVIAALAIFIIGRILAKVLSNLLRKMLLRLDADQILVRFVGNLTYTLLLTVVLLAAVGQLGVQTTSFIAILGAAGLAIGLALQNSLGNLAAGVMIVLFRPYRVGDYVEAAGVGGVVEEVQIFTTVLHTLDNKKVIVPNGQIVDGTITNYSAYETRRIDLIFGAGYDDPVGKVKETLLSIATSDNRVLRDPAPEVFVQELADSSVNFGVRLWVNRADYFGVKCDTIEAVKLRFDEEGLSIPYPQQDNHVRQVAAAS